MSSKQPVLADDVGRRAAPSGDPLTERLRRGSREAMAEAFQTHLDVIYNYCYRRCGSWAALAGAPRLGHGAAGLVE